MKVVIAKRAGFCMGVRRAVHLALKAASEAEKPVYTYGPLIHNPQALGLLEALEVRILKQIPDKGRGTVIIRAHGVTPEEKESLKKAGFRIIDGTCPRVLKVQALAKRFSSKGYHVIVIGDPEHAEVRGILGYAGEKGLVVSKPEDVAKLPPLEKYVILSQTTQDERFFETTSQEILKRFPQGEIYNTICNATHQRQEEVRNLCKNCEAIVVVGGKHSANTNRLAMIAKKEKRDVFLVETAEELPLETLKQYRLIGITAGASTPNWVINQVVRTIEELPSPYESFLKRIIRKILRFSFESNLALAIGATALSISAIFLMHISFSWIYPLLAGSFIFSAHTLNRITDIHFLRLNDPFRARFLEKHRKWLLVLCLFGYMFSMLLASKLGKVPFRLTIILGIITAIYSIPFIWLSKGAKGRWPPGGKGFLIASAWTAITAIIPWITSNNSSLPYLALSFVFLIAFIRAIFLEILEVQGDGFVGKDTLPVFLGEEKTFYILKIVIALLTVEIGAMYFFDKLFISEILLLFFVPLYAFYTLRLYTKRLLGQSFLLEALSEGLPIIVFMCVIFGFIIEKLHTKI